MKILIIIFLLSIYYLLNIILVVAFLTLLERKILASIHKRKGPNVVGFLGLLQPIADAVKLVFKENPVPQNASSLLFFLGPSILLVLSLSAWFVIPFNDEVIVSDLNVGILYIFMVSSLNALNIIISGWSSNSRYAFLGALRSIAQVIAYEVVIGIIIINVLVFSGSLNLLQIIWAQKYWWFSFSLWFQFILFFIAMLAETNRHPFDLAEAESELVSGYNVEHGSILFAVFFLAEYANIILLSHVVTILFLGGWTLPDFISIFCLLFNFMSSFVDGFLNFEYFNKTFLNINEYLADSSLSWFFNSFVYNLKVFLMLFFFIWVRASLPRYRYDQLMRLGWKVFVPFTLGLFFISIFLLWFFSGYPPVNGVIFL